MNEVIELLTQFIGSVGFPIFACIILFKNNEKFSETITANTEALNKLAERIERMTDDDT